MDSQPVTTTTVGMLPRRSNKMCSLTADVLRRNWARGKSDKQEIDGGRIQRVNRLIEFEPKRLVSIKFSRFR